MLEILILKLDDEIMTYFGKCGPEKIKYFMLYFVLEVLYTSLYWDVLLLMCTNVCMLLLRIVLRWKNVHQRYSMNSPHLVHFLPLIWGKTHLIEGSVLSCIISVAVPQGFDVQRVISCETTIPQSITYALSYCINCQLSLNLMPFSVD